MTIRHTTRRTCSALVLLLGTMMLHAVAQTAQPAAKPLTVAVNTETANLACNPKAMAATGFNECKQMRLDNFVLLLKSNGEQQQALQQQTAQLQKQAMEFIQRVTAVHPGLQYESPSATFPTGRLTALPKPAPPAQPAHSDAGKK